MFLKKSFRQVLRSVILTFALLIPVGAIMAQNISVSGTVTDKSSEPLPGVYVVLQGNKTVGTATDVDGKYTISVPSNATLIFTSMGMQDAVIPVNGRSVINVVMAEDATTLNDIVVVGYGTQKRANLTGAVATVDVGKNLEAKPVSDVGKALQGSVPGLTVINNNGSIDAEPTITVRGIGTLSNSGTSTPLYVVDGVPMESLSYLNPNDIASISVLKDAASTSIYGTRAAFGVVLITTKTANTEDKVSVSYTGNFGWSQATHLPNYSTVVEQIAAFNEANIAYGQDPELFGMYTNTEAYLNAAQAWQDKHKGKAGYREMVEGDDYFYDANGVANYVADWDVRKIMFNNATPSQNHNVAIKGKSDKTNYYLAFGYDKEQGILNFNPDHVYKHNLTANISTKIRPWLTVGTRINYYDKKYSYPYLRQNTYQYMWRWGSMFGPWGYMRDSEGNKYDCRQAIGFRNEAGDAYTKLDNFRITGFLKADIVKGLTLNADYTYTYKTIRYKGVGLPATVWNTWGGFSNKTTEPSVLSTTSFVETSRSFTKNHVVNIYGNYQITLANDHNINVMAGFNADENEYEYLYYENHDILDFNKPELALTPTFYSYTHNHTSTGSAGFFGRLNYDYKGKYLVEGNIRYDGSSKFPSNSRWATFTSFSAGWRISEEKFFEPIKEVVNNAKLRASYGEIGNQEIGNNMFLKTMSRVSNGVYWLGSNNLKMDYFGTPKMVSEDLTWESVATTNVGLDLGFFKGDLNVTFDWFQRETKGMLAVGQTLPQVLGTTAAYENAGTLRSRGWEINLDYHHTFENGLNIYGNFNLSDYKTVVTKWENDTKLLNQNYSGKEYGAIWGFKTDRYFTSAEDVANSPSQKLLESGKFVYGPGDIKFKDIDGDNEINWGKGTEDDHGDLVKIGNSTPRYQYSLRLGASWKGFDLDLYMQGVGKRSVWTTSAFVIPFSRGTDAIYANQMSYISQEDIANGNIDQSKDHPRMWGGANGGRGNIGSSILAGGGRFNYYPQDKYLTNMAYLRMKNITLGYTIPQNLTQKASIEKVRVYVSVYNAFDIINHSKGTGIDPEINTGSGMSADAGAWGRTDPMMRTFSCGVQVTF